MKKRFVSFLTSLVMVISLVSVVPSMTAEALKSGDYEYEILSDGTVEITKYNGSDSELTIQSTIAGKKVTSIGKSAFLDCENILNITIPNSVTSIGDYAFLGCNSLTSVTIGNNVTSIGDCAFWECTSLTSISVDSNNQNYSSQDEVLFNKNKTELIQYPIGNTRTSYTIPNSVTEIGDVAFCCCISLTSVTIPNSVTSVGYHAFNGCENLKIISIPNGMTEIRAFSFGNCKNLKTVTIPNGVETIDNDAFYNCPNLKTITIPKSVTYMEHCSLGYYWGEFSYTKIPDFNIKCYKNTAGEKYAKENGFDYELLDGVSVPTVSNFKVTKTAYNAIKLGWNAVPNADGYIIWRYDFAKKQWIQINNNVKTNSFLFTHLNSGTKYRFAVRAFKKIDGKVYTSPSFPVADGYTNLPTVSGFKVTATANNAIKLGWNKVAGANGYYIYRYDYTKKQWKLINNNVKTNSFLFTHLNSGTNYKFAVRAYKTVDGKNILSQSFPTVETSTNPANVNFSLSSSSGRVNVKWNKVAGATGYMVFYKTSANGSWNKITQVNANTTSCVKTGLKKGQTYYFMVRTYKTLGKTNFLANYNTKSIKVK